MDFYKAAFGAVEDYRAGGTDDEEEVVAQLSVGEASFWVADESPPHRNFSPESLGGATVEIGRPQMAWPPAAGSITAR
ncbi:MAG: hypothetical protein M3350_07600 [Actinomycetota bacterium]|nr:hypothetical protein [Actinomycetota bacterium]